MALELEGRKDEMGKINNYTPMKSFKDNEFFFDYKKKEIKDKRKMGHLTILKS